VLTDFERHFLEGAEHSGGRYMEPLGAYLAEKIKTDERLRVEAEEYETLVEKRLRLLDGVPFRGTADSFPAPGIIRLPARTGICGVEPNSPTTPGW
jgi:hypothetical protein